MFEPRPLSMLPIAAMLVLAIACGGTPEQAPGPGPDSAPAEEGPVVAGPPVGVWNLIAIDGVPIPADVDVTLTIEAGGRVSGGSGCNRYTAAATFEGASIRVGPVAGTRMACPEPLMDLETNYLTTIDVVETFEADGDALRLLDGGGATRLEFRRASDEDAAA